MGREIRKVRADWKHPKRGGKYVPLHDGADLKRRTEDWDRSAAAWARGEFPDYASEESRKLTYEEWDGKRPSPGDYMPAWTPEEATHFQMYETTTEGTPISPVLSSPEAVARWCADNGASAFGGMTQSYEAWLSIARGDSSIGMIMGPGVAPMPDAEFRVQHPPSE